MNVFIFLVCKIGEVKIIKGYKFLVRFVIYIVGFRYNIKYIIVVESVLFSCYRSVLG